MKRALFLCMLLGCDPPPAAPPPAPTTAPAPTTTNVPSPTRPPAFAPVSDEVLAALAEANDTFALALYAHLERSSDNVALSPASVAVALAMTYAGAQGETAAQMKAALSLEGLAKPHAAYGTLLRTWSVEPKMPFALRVANRLFAADGFALLPSFVALTSEHYQAPVETLPFSTAPDEARSHINDWVAKQTEQKIEILLPPGSIDQDTRLVLTNAIYFRGTWASPFEEKATREAPFYAPSGEIAAPTMHQKAFFRYADIDGAKLLDMPYRGGRFSMTFVLPGEREGLDALEKRLTHEALTGWLNKLSRFEVRVALPRFTVDPAEPIALSTALRSMGMTDVFDAAKADLGGIAETPPGQNLFLSEVFHQAFVKVDEKGTEAAAATGAVVSVTSLPIGKPEPKTFVADHPFLFFLRDTETKSLLFIGRVVAPR